MGKRGLRCPKCGTMMSKSTKEGYLDPFEIKYKCRKCETTYIFHSWEEYYEACEWEELKKDKRSRYFNPSVRGSVA